MFGEFDDLFMQKSSKPNYSSLKNDMGSSMKIDKLTAYPFEEGYGPTTKKHNIMNELLNRKKEGGESYYIRGHLLNDNLGGVGEWKNMTPLTQDANKEHLNKIESKLKKGVDEGKVYNYEVTPDYKIGKFDLKRSENEPDKFFEDKQKIAGQEQHIAKSIKAEYFEVEKSKDRTQKIQPKKGGDKGSETIYNDIGESHESKDYILKGDNVGDRKEKPIILDESSNLDFMQISELFGVSIDAANLIISNLPYSDSDKLYNKILTKMNEDIITYKEDIDSWKKGNIAAIKKLYDNKKIKFSKKNSN